MPASRRTILQLLDSLEGPIAKAFREAVAGVTSRARINQIEAAIRRGDVEAVMRAAGVRPGSWSAVTEAVRNGYVEAGAFTIAADVPARLGMAFNVNNPRAEAWIRTHSSEWVTNINDDVRESIRVALNQGMAAGRNPRSTALDIVGRVSKQTGRRTGGVIGLTDQQAQFALNARSDLENLSSRYFTRQRRDKRFDRMVRSAIESGEPLSQEQINRIVGRYEDRLLQLRGENVARTEALGALNEASDEALRQVVDEGLAPQESIIRIWDATLDARTRPDHVAADGQERGLNEAFDVGGVAMMHPGDFSAPAEQVINCRCVARHQIDFVAVEEAA